MCCMFSHAMKFSGRVRPASRQRLASVVFPIPGRNQGNKTAVAIEAVLKRFQRLSMRTAEIQTSRIGASPNGSSRKPKYCNNIALLNTARPCIGLSKWPANSFGGWDVGFILSGISFAFPASQYTTSYLYLRLRSFLHPSPSRSPRACTFPAPKEVQPIGSLPENVRFLSGRPARDDEPPGSLPGSFDRIV